MFVSLRFMFKKIWLCVFELWPNSFWIRLTCVKACVFKVCEAYMNDIINLKIIIADMCEIKLNFWPCLGKFPGNASVKFVAIPS